MSDRTVLITYHDDTLEMDIDAPDLALDIVISFLQRALRQCENAEKVVVAQQVSAAVRDAAENQGRTRRVLSNLKM
jgi:transposase-like protein